MSGSPSSTPVFALGPGRGNTILDYSNPSHVKAYYKAITSLDNKFDGKPTHLHVFLQSVSNCAKNFGWNNILHIEDSLRTTRNLLNEYGLLTIKSIQNFAKTNWINQHVLDAPNSEMLYHFLFESLEDSFKATILLKTNNYCITMGTYTTEDGPCLLKQIIISTFMDTRATVAQIRESLVDMSNEFEKQKGNIMTFNEWVEDQVMILYSRGEEVHNLLTYLCKTYQKAPDSKFIEYIQGLRTVISQERQISPHKNL